MHKKKAFTLVELLIVVALASLLAGLVIHQFTFMRGHVRSELDGLYQACLYMQRHALVTRQTQVLTLNLDQQSYQFNGRRHALAKGFSLAYCRQKGRHRHQRSH